MSVSDALGEEDDVAQLPRLVLGQVAVHCLQQRLRRRHCAEELLQAFNSSGVYL